MQTIFIVTPVYNGADFIDRSIQHVLAQSGNFRIRYHIQDGGSTDGTLEKLAAWQERLTENKQPIFCKGIEFTYASEADKSMYEALTKGFAALDDAPEDAFMTWINHDDLLLPGSCALAAKLASQFDKKDVAWFTGTHNVTARDGSPIPFWAFPMPQSFIANGVADARLMGCVQQEGTYFRKWLWDAVDKTEAFDGLRRAGDWNLWRHMSRHTPLYQVEWMQTGRFSFRDGQLTDGFTEYLNEINGVIGRKERLQRFIELVETEPLFTPSLYYNTHEHVYEKRDRWTTKFKMLEQASWNVPEIEPLFAEVAAQSQMVADAQAVVKEMNLSADTLRSSLDRLSQFEQLNLSSDALRSSLNRLSHFEMMSPVEVRDLVDDEDKRNAGWRKELIKAPHQISKWRALRRFERRSKRARLNQFEALATELQARTSEVETMNDQSTAITCLPSKNDLMRRLKADGFQFGSVLDVGVMTCTYELMSHFSDVPQLLCEPVEEFHDQIREYYDGASVDYILEPRAVSATTGTSELEILSLPGIEGISHSTLVSEEPVSDNRRSIQTVTLDTSVAENEMKAPFLLKVDVDGFEMEVLEGATETLKQTAVVIIEAMFKRFSEIDAFLTANGFEIYDIIDLCYYDGKFWQCDLVYFKEDLAKSMGVIRKGTTSDLSTYQNFIPEDHAAPPPSPPETSVVVHNELNAKERMELENYRLLVPEAIRQLAKAGPLSPTDWKNAFKEKPTKVSNWYPLKRAARRLDRRAEAYIEALSPTSQQPSAGEQHVSDASADWFETPAFAQQDVRVGALINRLQIPVNCVIDVGAANGGWTECLKPVFPNADFHLFEPLASHAPLYRDAFKERKAAGEQFTLHEIALSNSDGEGEIELHDSPYGSSLLHVSSADQLPSVKVRLAKLDSLFKSGEIPQADIIKLDTQGTELQILQGAVNLLRETKFVVVESWFFRGYGSDTPILTEVIAFMAEQGFLPFDHGDPWRQDTDGRLGCLDIWFANTSIDALGMPR